MVSSNGLEGKLLISDLKGTMSSIELLTLYPPAPGFSLEVILLNISQIWPAELESSDELIAQGGVVLRVPCSKNISVTDENAGAYLYLHVIHSLLFINLKFSREWHKFP